MTALWHGLGALLAFAGLADVFFTVLHYDSRGIVATRAYRIAWRAGRRAVGALPTELRSVTLSLLAPVMVALTVVGWLAAEVLGFALLFYPSILQGGFSLGQVRPAFPAALYFSLASLTSLSLSDVEPRFTGDHLLAAVETLVGLALLTLAIAYMANLYRALQEQSVLASRLHQRTGGSGNGWDIVRAHFRGGQAIDLGSELGEMHASLLSQYESLRRYPVVYYFHARVPYRSIPYVFRVIGNVIIPLRFGLPDTHPAAHDPWLNGLVTAYSELLGRIEDEFLHRAVSSPPEPVSAELFRRDMTTQDGDDEHVRQFRQLTHFMREVAALAAEPLPQTYERYREWLPFAYRADEFVTTAAEQLGLDPRHLWEAPGRQLY